MFYNKKREIIERLKKYNHTVLIIALFSAIVAIKVVVVAGIASVATVIESAVREGLLIVPRWRNGTQRK